MGQSCSIQSVRQRRQTYDRDGDDENVDEGGALLRGRASRNTRAELDEEANHERAEEDETGERTELGNELGQSVELELERRGRGITAEGHHGTSVERVGADGDDDVLADTLEDLAARDEEAVELEALLGRRAAVGATLSHALFVGNLLDRV